MTGYRLSPAAQFDLEDIWDYSVRNWGEAQAERYVLAIRDACDGLAGGRRQGRRVEYVRSGYRSFPVRSHVVFFRLHEDGIDVIRILHRRMDLSTHLGDA